MSQVLHLNGAPGVGKSTLAQRWADAHPGTLVVEADALRTWVSGWRDDFVAVGARIRPVALAMITAYAAAGHDVVVPQLVANAPELARFRAAAVDGGASFVEVLLMGESRERLEARALDQPWLAEVRRLVAAAGPGHLDSYDVRLAELASTLRDVIVLETTTGDIDGAYAALVAAVKPTLS